MDLQYVITTAVTAPKGTNQKLCWTRPVKVKKNCPYREVTKTTCAVGRLGVTYDNQAKVKAKRESGELPKENQGLAKSYRWHWFPFVLQNVNTGSYQLRFAPNTLGIPSIVTYHVDGVETSYADIEQYLYSGEKRKPKDAPRPDAFNVKFENLTSICNVEV